MAEGHSDRVALMAIQPIYAQAILAGRKRVEFRKRALAADVDTVVIYETSPTRQVIGEFTVTGTVIDTPRRLWRRFRDVAGISACDYAKYFEGQVSAVALRIAKTRRYEAPLALDDLHPRPGTPQSFIYLPREIVTEAQRRQRRNISTTGLGTVPDSQDLTHAACGWAGRLRSQEGRHVRQVGQLRDLSARRQR